MITRRDWLRIVGGISCFSASGWIESLAAETHRHPQRKRSCILLWMPGGPSQLDTFDPKPGHDNGGPFKAISTSVPGIAISEHLPKIAKQMQHAAIVRSMSTKEGEHQRASILMQTGYLPGGPIRYPSIGSLFSKELLDPHSELPGFVSIAPFFFGSSGPGFLGPQFAPMVIGNGRVGPQQQQAGNQSKFGPPLRVENLDSPAGITAKQAEARLGLLGQLDEDFGSRRPGTPVVSHRAAYERAVRLMKAKESAAFDLDEEANSVREKYGANQFGQGCLMARRLVERGVPFVEVSLAGAGKSQIGWDTHFNNFESVQSLSAVLDTAWSTLVDDLKQRGLLDSTLIVWMGEFGRTPKINMNKGRDHFPVAWSTVLMGGGIKGGQVIGKTSKDGMTVDERPVAVGDFLATICGALEVDPTKQNISNVGRPIRIIDPKAKSIKDVVV
jgi:hypothetical protein